QAEVLGRGPSRPIQQPHRHVDVDVEHLARVSWKIAVAPRLSGMDDNIYHLWETGILDRRRSIPNHGRSERDRRSWPANAEKLVSLGHQPGPEGRTDKPGTACQ
ncbi:hypothetical protein chiPu_0030671, partial [Chiloscyllium punctatum]|nr:hypothetical protein [Chiloscyllium punctatum]